jgi:hypothetical protein
MAKPPPRTKAIIGRRENQMLTEGILPSNTRDRHLARRQSDAQADGTKAVEESAAPADELAAQDDHDGAEPGAGLPTPSRSPPTTHRPDHHTDWNGTDPKRSRGFLPGFILENRFYRERGELE